MTGLIVIKYGGNAMRDETVTTQIVQQIADLHRQGARVVVVHGGGPFIAETLELAGVESTFVGGHRVTTGEALRYVEMALKGRVNGDLVQRFNSTGLRAVGLSGKDGRMVTATRRLHREEKDGKLHEHDLGQVGDVASVDPALLELLLDRGYLPVMTCIASDEHGTDYNINADMFAGHIAAALKADRYLVLTDVDGVYEDIHQPESFIPRMTLQEVEAAMGGIIVGGMIPKLESCRVALLHGAAEARIINGMKPDQLRMAAAGEECGTRIVHQGNNNGT
ncbi:acetylglutamate kinase [bacterium]|nr:acetylglutamate kinase [bacterium]